VEVVPEHSAGCSFGNGEVELAVAVKVFQLKWDN